MIKKNSTSRNSFGLVPLSSELGHIAKKVLGKHGFSNVDLLAHWDDIVGENLAQGMKPEKIVASKDRKNILYVHVLAGSFAVIVEHQKKIILDKINTFMGYDAVVDIKIKQDLSQIKLPSKPKKEEKELSEEQEKELQKKLEGITDETLKKQLYNIGKSIFLK